MGYNIFRNIQLKDSFKLKLKSFIETLGSAIKYGQKIPFADNDISYSLQLQHQRIAGKGLEINYELYDRDNKAGVHVCAEWKDTRYESYVCSEQYGVKRQINRDGKKLYSDKKKNYMYTTITDVMSGVHPDNEVISCPNCGNVSTIAQIQSGCPFCGTMYKMDDLFPKVTGYHFIEDVGVAGNEHKAGMALSVIITAAAMVSLLFLVTLLRGEPIDVETVLASFIMLPLGLFVGYIGYGSFLLIRLIVVGSRQSAGKWGTIGSRKNFEAKMREFSPDFSFEYFTSKAISLIKTAVYAPDAQQLLFYRGGPLDPRFKDVIDMNYGGAIGLSDFRQENGKVIITTDAFFDVLYANGDVITNRRERYKAVFQRRTDIPVDMGFSMTKIQCPTCGSSYNAVQNRLCPFCGNAYNIESQDWILTELSYQ